jgi:hypothetical protein
MKRTSGEAEGVIGRHMFLLASQKGLF